MLYTPSTQPITIGNVISRSLKLFRISFTKVFFLALLLSFIAFLPRILVIATGVNYFEDRDIFNPNQLWLLVIQIVSLTIFTIILWRIRCVKYGSHETLKDDMRITLKRIPYIIGAALVQSGILWAITLTTLLFYFMLDRHNLLPTPGSSDIYLLMVPLVLLLFVNTFIFFLFIFYLPLILTENKHIFSALGKSARLVWGNWWRTFIVQITPALVYLLTLIIIKNISNTPLHLYATPVNELTALNTTLQVIVLAIFIPWFGATLLVQLQDLELRKDAKETLNIVDKHPKKKLHK